MKRRRLQRGSPRDPGRLQTGGTPQLRGSYGPRFHLETQDPTLDRPTASPDPEEGLTRDPEAVRGLCLDPDLVPILDPGQDPGTGLGPRPGRIAYPRER